MRAHYSYLKGDNVAVAQCPASCGELIQGWILGSEKLVSCPVDWYSTVAVTAAPPLVNERPLSRAMVERVLAHWQYPAHWSNEIRVDVRSSIPVAKGMASSTADIAATAVATAHHLGHSLDETTLAQLCVSIEPTDSTVFHQLTLFDHNNAATQIACEPRRQSIAGTGKSGHTAHARLPPSPSPAEINSKFSNLAAGLESGAGSLYNAKSAPTG